MAVEIPFTLRTGTVDVDRPDLAWPHQYFERRRSCQKLLSRFYLQILHGCSDPACATRTCQSYQRQVCKGPFRPYSVLSARALAAYLASQDNPVQDLCPRGPAKQLAETDFLSIEKSPQDAAVLRRQKNSKSEEKRGTSVRQDDSAHGEFGGSIDAGQILEALPVNMTASPSMSSPKSTKMDMRSFTQRLFDTNACRTLLAPVSESISSSSISTKTPVTQEEFRTIPVQVPQALPYFSKNNVSDMYNGFLSIGVPGYAENKNILRSASRPPLSVGLTPSGDRSTIQSERAITFASQSIIHVLGNVNNLLASFRGPPYAWHGTSGQVDFEPVRKHHSVLWGHRTVTSFITICWYIEFNVGSHARIFPSLRLSLGEVERSRFLHYETKYILQSSGQQALRYKAHEISDSLDLGDLLHIFNTALAAFVISVPLCTPEGWTKIRNCRSAGQVVPRLESSQDKALDRQLLDVIDSLEDEMTLTLTKQLIRIASIHDARSRWALKQLEKDQTKEEVIFGIESNIFDSWMQHRIIDDNNNAFTFRQNISLEMSRQHIYSAVLELLRTIILKEWDGRALIPKTGLVAGAAGCLYGLYRNARAARLKAEDFHIPFLARRLDFMEMPSEWMDAPVNSTSVHLLSYSFLFPPTELHNYLRAYNHATMLKAYKDTRVLGRILCYAEREFGRGAIHYSDLLDKALKKFFVLEVSRSNILTDAMDQLWRRERREILKPLRVRLPAYEGDDLALDLGGVQREFFSLAIREALKASYGIFATDQRTRMSWFRPYALEPLYKYELLGVLTSLAVYNGHTLPVTFPLALYRKLLSHPVTELEHIQDGWPEIAKRLTELRNIQESEVEEWSLSYVFHLEAPYPVPNDTPGFEGSNEMRMELEWSETSNGQLFPKPGQTELKASPVTKENRLQFIRDYILWLAHKSIGPQYEAFEKGFYACLDRRALQLFSPAFLKALVEGSQEIDVDALEKTAKYEGCQQEGSLMKDFWDVVRSFSLEQRRQLLEFVTASDRVPFDGIGNVDFNIWWVEGDDERLPTSSTCYGRLFMPRYSSKEKMKEKLSLAIENSLGFGIV